MNQYSIIASGVPDADKRDIENTEIGVCCVTGLTCSTVPRKLIFGKSFCNIDVLQAPESDRVGVDAYQALAYKWERMSCFFASQDIFLRIQRQEIRDLVLNGSKSIPWVAYVTTSYKKHGAFYTPVNSSKFGIIRFENVTVDASDEYKNNDWYQVLYDALLAGFGRTVLETLECSPFVIQKVGLTQWIEFQNWAKNKYKSPLYQLLCYCLPTQDEIKKIRKEIEKEKDEEPKEIEKIDVEKDQMSLF